MKARRTQHSNGKILTLPTRKSVRSAAVVEIAIKHHPDWPLRLIANFINFLLKRQGLRRSAGIVSDYPPQPKPGQKIIPVETTTRRIIFKNGTECLFDGSYDGGIKVLDAVMRGR
jgi:hypothetical protein